MAIFGWHASHEQLPPSTLLEGAKAAERAGFRVAMCSDHFTPWNDRQGESGFAWSWLGAALEATSLPFGIVTAPGQRYHPAILAQAAATLTEMYPGRLWLAVGSGEAMNEHITGDPWPPKEVRNARLAECVEVMRALFAGETVTHKGLIDVDRARLYSRPDDPPLLLGAAVTAETARWLGGWADGLITINQEPEALRKVVDSFREGGGEGKRLTIQVHVCWAETDEEAERAAHDQWRTNIFEPPIPWDLETPEDFDKIARFVSPDDVRQSVLVSSDPSRHVDWLATFPELGFEHVYVHQVAKDQESFMDTYAEHVLPRLEG